MKHPRGPLMYTRGRCTRLAIAESRKASSYLPMSDMVSYAVSWVGAGGGGSFLVPCYYGQGHQLPGVGENILRTRGNSWRFQTSYFFGGEGWLPQETKSCEAHHCSDRKTKFATSQHHQKDDVFWSLRSPFANSNVRFDAGAKIQPLFLVN